MNVVSTHTIDSTVNGLTRYAIRPELKQWLGRVVPKHIKRSPELLDRVRTAKQLDDELGPKFNKDARKKLHELLDAGEKLLRFVPHGEGASRFSDEVRSVIDWLDAVPEWDRHLKRIDRMSYKDAAMLSAAWHEKLLKLSADADDPDVVEEAEEAMRFDDGCRFVELKGPVALLREGNLMGHCVGGRGYVEAVRMGATRIFSLRDPENRPHATIEVRRNVAIQIKGKGNQRPIDRWAAHVRPFVKDRKWAVHRDGNAIGLVTLDGRTYDHPDEIIDHMAKRPTRHGNSLQGIIPEGAKRILADRRNETSPAHRETLLEIVAMSATVDTPRTDVVVQGPEAAIQRFHHVVSTPILEALSDGLFAGIEESVANYLGAQVDMLLDRIEREPGHLHVIEFAGALPRKSGLLDQMAAFSGRLPRLAKARTLVESARRTNYADISSSIRRQTSPAVARRNESNRSWAHEVSQLRQASPDAIAESRNKFQAGAIL